MPFNQLNTLNDCALAFDLDQQLFLFISPGAVKVLGYNAIDFSKSPQLLFNMVDEGNRERVKMLSLSLLEGEWSELQYHIIAPDGNTKEVSDKKHLVRNEFTGNRILISLINDDGPQKYRHQEEARSREKFLNSLIDSQTNFLLRLSVTGKFTFINKQFLKLLGYTEQELLGKHFSYITLEEDLPHCNAAFSDCIDMPGAVIPLRHKKMAKDGSVFDTEWEFVSVTNDAGEISEIQGIGHDITHSNLIEKEIKETVEKLDSFIESITDSFFVLNRQWKFLKVNTAFEKLSGKKREDVLGCVIWNVFPILLGTTFEKAYHRAIDENITIQFIEHIGATSMWFNTTVYPSAEGITVFVKDITAEKHAREELMWTKNSLEALMNNTEDLIWSLDRGLRYVYMNKAYRSQILRITGVSPKESDYAYQHPGYTAAMIATWDGHYRRVLAGERFSITNENPDPLTGEIQSFEISFNPIYKSGHEITGIGCFAREITNRLKAEKAIMSQNERLRDIASISSHELRRPVASMLGLINVIDRDNFYNPDNQEVIEHLLTVGMEIDQVIRLIVNKTFTGEL
jgi:PAS domain S-box-containing protein